jgi:hypothetical protein
MSKPGEMVQLLREDYEDTLEAYRLLRNKFLKAVPGMDLDKEELLYKHWVTDLHLNSITDFDRKREVSVQPAQSKEEPTDSEREFADSILHIVKEELDITISEESWVHLKYVAIIPILRIALADREKERQECEWNREDDESDTWQGGCGILWTLTEGTPTENEMIYCPKCGRKIIEARAALVGKEAT